MMNRQNALTLLASQGYNAEEMRLLEAAANEVPWAELAPAIEGLQRPAEAEAAKDAAYGLLGDLDQQHNGLAGMCVFAAAMYGSARRLHVQGISKEVLARTYSCLRSMSATYSREYARFGFDRGFWIWRQASGTIFRLGALEYEYLPQLSASAAEKTGLAAGEPVLSIHIPFGTDLSRTALDDSYAAAHAFYQEGSAACLGGKAPQAIICDSWLLSPTLYGLLADGSGIRRFAGDFRICASEDKGEAHRHFLFLAGKDVPVADFPENTSLQRVVKAHLLAGGGIGSGMGVLQK